MVNGLNCAKRKKKTNEILKGSLRIRRNPIVLKAEGTAIETPPWVREPQHPPPSQPASQQPLLGRLVFKVGDRSWGGGRSSRRIPPPMVLKKNPASHVRRRGHSAPVGVGEMGINAIIMYIMHQAIYPGPMND